MYKISITAMQTVFTILAYIPTYVKLLKKTYIGIYLTL